MKGKMRSRNAKLRARLKGKRAEGLAELNAGLDMDRHENEIVDGGGGAE